jgi:antirestriction protein ArdC
MRSNYEQYQDYIEKIANEFYEAIQKDDVPWEKPWTAKELKYNMAHNPLTKTVYKGLNTLTLDILKNKNNYISNVWLTYKQAQELGGFVKKGEKSALISFFKMEKEKTGKELYKEFIENVKTYDDKQVVAKAILVEKNSLGYFEKSDLIDLLERKPLSGIGISEYFLKRISNKPIFKQSYVFNIDQIEGLDPQKVEELKFKANQDIKTLENFNDHKKCEKIIKNSNIPVVHVKDLDRAFYRPIEDKIYMPEKNQFKSEAAYYSTVLHELGHATGHQSRLNRNFGASKAGADYAKEELRAEIYSYLQAKELGIDYNLQNHQSYVKSWQKVLADSKQEIINAVKDAVKMVNYVNENYIERSLTKTQAHNLTKQNQTNQKQVQENER